MASKQEHAVRADRRDYEKPSLREFGPVGALTQSGTGDTSEAMTRMGILACNPGTFLETDPRC